MPAHGCRSQCTRPRLPARDRFGIGNDQLITGFEVALRILLVEDDQLLANIVARGLREHAYAVDVASDGDSAIYQAAVNSYDAVILDVMLPKRDGFAVCRELRRRGLATRVMMLTARDALDDRVAGLDTGNGKILHVEKDGRGE